jgi:hypothetical protein
MAGFGISSVEPWGSAIMEFVIFLISSWTLTRRHEMSTDLIETSLASNSNNLKQVYQHKITKYAPLSAEIKETWRQNQV